MEKKGTSQMNAPLALIVEDERDIADRFETEWCRIVTASNAADAVESCQRGPDVIFLDVNLPDGDGFEVCRKVRESVACPSSSSPRGWRTPTPSRDSPRAETTTSRSRSPSRSSARA